MVVEELSLWPKKHTEFWISLNDKSCALQQYKNPTNFSWWNMMPKFWIEWPQTRRGRFGVRFCKHLWKIGPPQVFYIPIYVSGKDKGKVQALMNLMLKLLKHAIYIRTKEIYGALVRDQTSQSNRVLVSKNVIATSYTSTSLHFILTRKRKHYYKHSHKLLRVLS